MLSNKPYLIRAFYEWIIDSACTPYLVINANFPNCIVPVDHIENGEIILNIAPVAVRDLKIGNQLLEFRASFSGVVHAISAPIKAILAIYAYENEQGMFFDYEDSETDESDAEIPESNQNPFSLVNGVQNLDQDKNSSPQKSKPKNVPHLKLVE